MEGSELSRESHFSGVSPKYEDHPPLVVTNSAPSDAGIVTTRDNRPTLAFVGCTVIEFKTKPSNSTRVFVLTVRLVACASPARSTAAGLTWTAVGLQLESLPVRPYITASRARGPH